MRMRRLYFAVRSLRLSEPVFICPAFVATAKAGKAKPDDIQGLQKKIASALEDDRVTGEELKGLTEHLRSMPKR